MSDQIGGQLPWGIEQLQPGSMKTISESKLATFAIGNQKKSRFQKAREEKEIKKKQEEEEAAKVYDQFVASFDVGDGSKAFIRGGKVKDDNEDNVYGGSRGEVYKLENRPKSAGSEMQRMLEELKERDEERSQRGGSDPRRSVAGSGSGQRAGPAESGGSVRPKEPVKSGTSTSFSSAAVAQMPPGIVRSMSSSSDKNKNIDDFLQELMSKHETGVGPGTGPSDFNLGPGVGSTFGSGLARIVSDPPQETDKGSFDNGDPATTNLYCGNLAPTITEELLYEIFGRFGPINSVKVMWPRTEEERLRKRNCGFVSFMSRRDAEDAKLELHDSIVEGYRMSVGWGKAVKINALPFQLPSASATAAATAAPVISAVQPPPAPTPTPSVLQAATDAQSAAQSQAQDRDKDRVGDVKDADRVETEEGAGVGGASTGARPKAGGGKWDTGPKVEVEREMTAEDEATAVRVVPPTDLRIRAIVDLTAKFVSIDGDAFEQNLRLREDGNPDFGFLSTPDSALGIYYRWRTYACVMGDDDSWREKPFQIATGGPFWIPPPSPVDQRERDRRGEERDRDRHRRRSASPHTDSRGERSSRPATDRPRDRERDRDRRRSRSRSRSAERDRPDRDRAGPNSKADSKSRYAGMTGAQIERMRAKERGALRASLSDDTYDEFEDMLHRLSVSREAIVQAMGLALDNADAAEEVVGVLKESLIIHSTPFPVKMARLYLLSDILHNSGCHVKNASNYRTHIQASLPDIFESLGATLRAASGRMSAKQIVDRVQGLLDVWARWAVFPPIFLVGLEAAFMRTEAEEQTVRTLALGEADGDLESTKKKARLNGVSVSTDSVAELVAKMAQVAEYARRKVMGLGADPFAGAGGGLGEVFLGGGPSPWQTQKSDDDVDGVPLDDVDGVPLDDVDGAPLDDVDGAPLDDVDGAPLDDVDGVPLDDVDGVPLGDVAPPRMQRWETVDSSPRAHPVDSRYEHDDDDGDGDESSDEGDGPGRIVIDSEAVDKTGKPAATAAAGMTMSEERRRVMLRATEAALLAVRDELEAQGRVGQELEAALEKERANLIAAWLQDERRTSGEGAAKSRDSTTPTTTAKRRRLSSSDSSSSSSDSSGRERRRRLREREREKDRDRERDDRNKERDRARDAKGGERRRRSPSSSSSDRGRASSRQSRPSSSSRGRKDDDSRDRDREREREREKEREKERKRTRRSSSSSGDGGGSRSARGKRDKDVRRR